MRKSIAAVLALPWLAAGVASAQTGGSGSGATGPFTLDVEALIWWYKSAPTPTPIITDGLYGDPDTSVLLGGGDMDTNPNVGFRITGAYALDRRWGLEGNFFYFDTRSTSRSVSSTGEEGSTDLLLPYYDTLVNRERVSEISYAPVYAGSAKEEMSNGLMGAELDVTYATDSARPWDVRLIGGFRWLQLKETYTITTSSPFIPPGPSDVWDTTDKFAATNNFYGAQLGARARYDADRWYGSGSLTVGLGGMVQSVDVSGSLLTNDFNDFAAPKTYVGGYYALPSNIGGHSRTEFAVVPELRLGVGYRLTPSASLYVAYDLLYASNVARPGEQVDRNINPTQNTAWTEEVDSVTEGTPAPTFSFDSTSFWAQGVNLGLSIRF